MKKFVAGLVCGAALMMATSVFADGALQQITAYLTPDVSVELDGQKVALQSAPVNYDGSTYLPVRELAGVVGLSVDWDNNTRTAKLSTGKKPAIAEPGSTAEAEKVGNPQSADITETFYKTYEAIQVNDTTYFRFTTTFMDDFIKKEGSDIKLEVDYEQRIIKIGEKIAHMDNPHEYYIFQDKAYLNVKFFPEKN